MQQVNDVEAAAAGARDDRVALLQPAQRLHLLHTHAAHTHSNHTATSHGLLAEEGTIGWAVGHCPSPSPRSTQQAHTLRPMVPTGAKIPVPLLTRRARVLSYAAGLGRVRCVDGGRCGLSRHRGLGQHEPGHRLPTGRVPYNDLAVHLARHHPRQGDDALPHAGAARDDAQDVRTHGQPHCCARRCRRQGRRGGSGRSCGCGPTRSTVRQPVHTHHLHSGRAVASIVGVPALQDTDVVVVVVAGGRCGRGSSADAC